MQKICHLYGAGEYYEPPKAARPGDLVIAADGGWAHLAAHGLSADLFIGDLDSLKSPPDGVDAVLLPEAKDETDMMAAIRIGFARGFRRFHLYGGTGGRPDHTLANLQCLGWIAQQGGRGFLFGREVVFTALHNGTVRFPKEAQGVFSAFAFGESAHGVEEVGLRYTLQNATLHNTNPLGVSNAFTGQESLVCLRNGTLLLVYPKDVQELSEALESDP